MRITLDGLQFAYTDEGPASDGRGGATLVLVHGFPLSRHCWQPQIDAFGPVCRTIAPDLRGFGDSDSSTGTIGMERFADDVAALLAEIGAAPAVLVGHSMGGYVCLAFARRHPDLLSGLVLVATRAGRDTPEAADGRRAAADGVRVDGAQGVIDAMTPKMLVPGADDEAMLTAIRGFMTPSSRDGVVGALLGMAERPDSTPSLGQIAVPTFVVTGDEDVIIDPAESEAMANAIPGALLQVIPDAGHLVAFEQAEAFNRELLEWLESARLVG